MTDSTDREHLEDSNGANFGSFTDENRIHVNRSDGNGAEEASTDENNEKQRPGDDESGEPS